MNWKNIKYSVVVSASLLLLASCWSNNEPAKIKPFNPNGDSELAILMRKMVKTLETNKELLRNNQPPEDFSFDVAELLTAEPTKGSINDRPAYEAFTNNFIDSVAVFYTESANKVKNYNALINACISCHETFCMGPIPVMQRLKFSNHQVDSLEQITK